MYLRAVCNHHSYQQRFLKQNEGSKRLEKKLRSSTSPFPEDVTKVATSHWLASLEAQV